MKWLILLLPILFSGCITEKRCSSKYPPQVRVDSIYVYKVVEKWKDTVIYKELPPVYIEKFVPIRDTLVLIGKYSKATAWTSDNILTGWLKEGERPVRIEYKIKTVYVDKEKIVDKIITKEVKFVPWIYKALSLIGVLFILFIAFKVFR
jgi:hypothetical protein